MDKIVFIGAGNLATHLSKALQNVGFDIIQVFSRSESSARALAETLQTQYTTEISCIFSDASLYIVSVSDDAIAPITEKLPLTRQLVVHTAGSMPMEIFAGKLQNYGVIYPLQTFSKSRPVDFADIPFFLEANTSENLQQLRYVAEKISDKVFEAAFAERVQLHLAAVFGCNFVNSLYAVSAEIASQAGFDFGILSSLIFETARKAIDSGSPKSVQTGPAVRNDLNVIQKHLHLLASHPDWQNLYTQLSKYIGETSG